MFMILFILFNHGSTYWYHSYEITLVIHIHIPISEKKYLPLLQAVYGYFVNHLKEWIDSSKRLAISCMPNNAVIEWLVSVHFFIIFVVLLRQTDIYFDTRQIYQITFCCQQNIRNKTFKFFHVWYHTKIHDPWKE